MKRFILLVLLLPVSALAQFPTAGPNPTTADGFTESRAIASRADARAGAMRADMTVGAVRLWEILKFAEWLSQRNERLDVIKAIPGIAQFARDQLDDQTLDIAVEFNAMQAAIEAFIDEVRTSSPASGIYAEVLVIGGTTGTLTLTERELTPAQTATLRTLLQAIEDSIE